MADKKVTELTALTTTAGNDLLYIVDDPTGTPVSKKITTNDFFGAVAANTVHNGTVTHNANTTLSGSNTAISANVNFTKAGAGQVKITSGSITLSGAATVTSNNATTQLGAGGLQGTIFWDADYLYVATSNTVVKRVALSVFDS